MAMEIDALEEAKIAKVGQRCRVVSLGAKDTKIDWVSVGDELEIVDKHYSSDNVYLWFNNITTKNKDREFLYEGSIIERIKD